MSGPAAMATDDAPFPILQLNADLLLALVNRLDSKNDAGRLACVCKQLRDGVGRSLPVSMWPRIEADGNVLPPASGQYHAVAKHKDGWPGVRRAFDRVPTGGSLLIDAGEFVVPVSADNWRIWRECHVFGAGCVVRMAAGSRAVLSCLARRGSVTGVTVAPSANGVIVECGIQVNGGMRVSRCTVLPGTASYGLEVDGQSGNPGPTVISRCVIDGVYTGAYISTSAPVEVSDCVISGRGVGLAVSYASTTVLRNRIVNSPVGVTVGPAAYGFALGRTNVFEGCAKTM